MKLEITKKERRSKPKSNEKKYHRIPTSNIITKLYKEEKVVSTNVEIGRETRDEDNESTKNHRKIEWWHQRINGKLKKTLGKQ